LGGGFGERSEHRRGMALGLAVEGVGARHRGQGDESHRCCVPQGRAHIDGERPQRGSTNRGSYSLTCLKRQARIRINTHNARLFSSGHSEARVTTGSRDVIWVTSAVSALLVSGPFMGIRIVAVVPSPGIELKCNVPSCNSTSPLTIERPRPVPS